MFGTLRWFPWRAQVTPILVVLMAVFDQQPAMAADEDEFELAMGALVTVDLLANLSGGLSRGVETPGLVDFIAEGRYQSRPQAGRHRFWFNLQGSFGGDLSVERSGDLQVVSSIEAPDTVKVFEAWYAYEQASATLLIGLHDLNREFYVLERAATLLHSSFGFGPDLSQANASQFPTTAAGVVLRYDPEQPFYLSAAAYDGVPGDLDDPYGTHIKFADGDGVLVIAEGGLSTADAVAGAMKAAFGVWYSSARYRDSAGNARNANSGAYLIVEAPVPIAPLRDSLGFFAQFGLTRAGRSDIQHYFGAGLHWQGPFARRPDDVFTVGLARAALSRQYRRAVGTRHACRNRHRGELRLAGQCLAGRTTRCAADPRSGGGAGRRRCGGCRAAHRARPAVILSARRSRWSVFRTPAVEHHHPDGGKHEGHVNNHVPQQFVVGDLFRGKKNFQQMDR